ncbi:MAG: Fic family protein [Elusimicrobiales bacterium]
MKVALKEWNRKYYYWEQFRQLPMPAGISAEKAWAARKIYSFGQAREFPLRDRGGRHFSYWLPEQAQEWLHLIDRNSAVSARLEGMPSREERIRYIISSLMEEAIASSQIEGAAVTRKEAKEMLRSNRAPANRHEQMVVNNYRAIEEIRRNLKDASLTVEAIRRLHSIVTEGTLDTPADSGRFRRSPEDDDVKVFDGEGTILHTPPSGAELEERMNRLIAFANDDSEFMHPVVKAILLHFWVGYDHPFVDGNGRTARAIFYWHMLRSGYSPFEYISISRIVLKSSGQYMRAFLHSELDGGDATYFIMYNLRVIHDAASEIMRHIARKNEEAARSAGMLRKFPGLNHRQREILGDALKKPGRIYAIRRHAQIQNVAYGTAYADLMDLAKRGLMLKTKSGRNYVFIASEGFEAKLQADADHTL